MPRLAHPSGNPVQRLGMLGRFSRELQRFTRAWRTAFRLPVHVEIAFDLAPLFSEQHRQEKARTEDFAEAGEQSSAGTRIEGARLPAVLAQQPRPDLDMAVLDFGEPAIEVAFFRVGLGRRE